MKVPSFEEFVDGSLRTAYFYRCKLSTQQRMNSALRTQLLPTFGPYRLDEIGSSDVHEGSTTTAIGRPQARIGFWTF